MCLCVCVCVVLMQLIIAKLRRSHLRRFEVYKVSHGGTHTCTDTEGSSHTVAHRHKHTQTHTCTPIQTMALPRLVHPARSVSFVFVPACPKCILESHSSLLSQLGVQPSLIPALLRFLLCHSKPALLTPEARHRSCCLHTLPTFTPWPEIITESKSKFLFFRSS